MGFEIDFLPVGNGDRSGDAIALRYGVPGDYKILVYDGGTKESGQELVNHIKFYYQTSRVDFVVCSHPDSDHASGLSVVLEQLQVGELWMHRPWNYSSVILNYFKDTRITDTSLASRLKDKMDSAYQLEQLAIKKKIKISEPFRGAAIGAFVVVSPEKTWYVHDLIANFEKSPEQKELSLAKVAAKALAEVGKKAVAWIAEQWNLESLRQDVETSAENESSVVLLGSIDQQGIMLTGDAGIKALTMTADFTETNNVFLPSMLKFIQVPHHGSRHNVSPGVLDRILGLKKIQDDGARSKTAFVSASEKSTTHPRKSVINAFIRRGVNVIATKGTAKRNYYNMPPRENWTTVTPLSFSNQVESWD
jgi:beta-lactamase superfamily II metal-dependent hydrolase